MDPDAALQAARDALARIDALDAAEGDLITYIEDVNDAVGDALEHYRALDEWITKGGFLPKAWADTVGALPAL